MEETRRIHRTLLRHPRRVVYASLGPDGEARGFWVPIGAGWLCRDGSLRLRVDTLPVSGHLHVSGPEGGPRARTSLR